MLAFKASEQLKEMMISKGVFHAKDDTLSPKRVLWLLGSLLLIILAQADWSLNACILTSFLGYALFWHSIEECSNKKKFYLSCMGMTLIQLLHQGWLARPDFIGPAIYAGWLLHAVSYGIAFGCLTLFVSRTMSFAATLGVAGLWVLLEWARPWLFFGLGFAWNPIGLTLAAHPFSLLTAALGGVIGLSFWVIWTNALLFRFKAWGLLAAALPYVVGSGLYLYHAPRVEKSEKIHALLLQQAKMPWTPAVEVWSTLYALIANHLDQHFDLIVLPEGSLPSCAHHRYIPKQAAKDFFAHFWGHEFPEVAEISLFSNLEIVGAMSKILRTPFIVGMNDDLGTAGYFNAAFFVHPQQVIDKYYKCYLLPFGEYLPFCFRWARLFMPEEWSFSQGSETKVFGKDLPIGVSICYEETMSMINRKCRRAGAEVLVGLTNDVWYPRSRLPVAHLYHARVRTVELGIPMLRASNTGVTCSIDSLGRILGYLPYETGTKRAEPGALEVSVPRYHYKTPYLLWGDGFVIGLSIICLAYWRLSKNSRIV